MPVHRPPLAGPRNEGVRRPRPAAVAAIALLATLLLAGCGSGPSDGKAGGKDGDAAFVAGVVVDLAVRPLSGVRITIPQLPAIPAQVTGDDGRFRFADVPTGALVLQAAKAGYLTLAVQVTAGIDEDAPVAKLVLESLPATAPYAVTETFEGFLDCGIGSGVALGFAVACTQTAGSALVLLCGGGGPLPGLGVCVDQADPYFHVQSTGNLSMAQTELLWDPSVGGLTELQFVLYVIGPDGAILKGAGAAGGASPLVHRLGPVDVADNDLAGVNTLSIYVGPAPGATVNVALQQSYQGFHTTAYNFLLDDDWTFVADGPVVVPPSCTTCA